MMIVTNISSYAMWQDTLGLTFQLMDAMMNVMFISRVPQRVSISSWNGDFTDD